METQVAGGSQETNMDELFDAIKKAARTEGTIKYYDGGLGGPKLSSGRAVFDYFREKTGIEIEWYTSGPEAMITRIWNEAHFGGLQFDVLHGYDLAWLWLDLKEQQRLMKYVPPEAAALYRGNSDPDGYFHQFSGALCVSMYNPEKLKPAELPKSYKDFVDPRWKNRICTPDWIYSRNPLMVPLMTWLYALHGPDYITALAGQNLHYTPEPNTGINMLKAGEADLIMGAGAPRYVEAKKKDEPIAYFNVEEGIFHRLTFVGINAQTKKPNLSKLFVRYLLSRDVQKIRVEADFESARPDLPTPNWYPPLAQLEQEGRLFGDNSPYWVDMQKRYRKIALDTYINALDKHGKVTGESTHPFQKLVDRVPGKIRGDGYNTQYGKPRS